MAKITIGSLNCRGLASDQVKRRDIFSMCRDRFDITLLVDTHSTKGSEKIWKSEWGYEALFCSHTSSSRGTAILFKNSFAYQIHNTVYDTQGNFIIVNIDIQDQRLTLAAIYGPNEDNPTFYDKFFSEIQKIGNLSILIGGDWNVPRNYEIDTRNYRHNNNKKANEKITHFMENLDLHDVWRLENKDARRYTWRGPSNKLSRLDYFIVSSDLQSFVESAEIHIRYRSDHNLISLKFSFIDQKRGKGFWKFNNSLLYDPDYVALVKNVISDTIHQYSNNNNNN